MHIAFFAVSIENLKNLKYHISYEKYYLKTSIICSKCKNEEEKAFKEEESSEYYKFLV